MQTQSEKLPVIPLRGTVLFPAQNIPISVGRKRTLKAVERALSLDRQVFVVTQRVDIEDPTRTDLFDVGVVARVAEVQKMRGGLQLQMEGLHRAFAQKYEIDEGGIFATVTPIQDTAPLDTKTPAYQALFKEVREQALQLGTAQGIPREILEQFVADTSEPGPFADLVASHIDIQALEKQRILELASIEERLRAVLVHIRQQIAILAAQSEIKDQVEKDLGSRQREVILREQLKAIQRKLGEDEEGLADLEVLKEKLSSLKLPEVARKEVNRELARLERTAKEGMEAQVIRTYLEWITELPWDKRSEEHLDLREAIRVLEEDHYGLQDVKERVLEFLAVRHMKAARNESGRSPILLFVGPPGVGKTSIAKSVARATGREYVRISLGGARDEADIRGHRRTYVGAMPGRIIEGLKRAGTKNPVFVLDEVDKLGSSFHGDPASALLEVLDPAQNDSFVDHYLNIPFDLSEVMFVATANLLSGIPAPLLDRMEIVDFSGYTSAEKEEIARRYLIPRQAEECGVADREIVFAAEALSSIIDEYTRESGVRNLEQKIGKVLRKLTRKIAAGESVPAQIDGAFVREALGHPKVRPEHAATQDEVGVATGMFYTPAGGDIMFVEAALRRTGGVTGAGSGEATGLGNVSLILTGQLGDVMKESARAALTYATTHSDELGIAASALNSLEVHIHVPAGAIPKDGPSAGITMATALISAMTNTAVRRDVAMTGEVTLRGRVLPIGGLKEKVLGAHRAGIRHIILPVENEADIEDVPEQARKDLTFHPVSHLEEVLALALVGGRTFGRPPSSALGNEAAA